jgi:hypothetical protein
VSRASWRRAETSVQEEARDNGITSAAAEAFSFFELPTHRSLEISSFRRVPGLIYGVPHSGQAAKGIGFNSGMHVGYYLMIAALVLMGLEVLYALYQLATFL